MFIIQEIEDAFQDKKNTIAVWSNMESLKRWAHINSTACCLRLNVQVDQPIPSQPQTKSQTKWALE
jgi:hypothetical protein